MKNIIPTNFKIPKDFEEFNLIEGKRGTVVLMVEDGRLHCGSKGRFSQKEESMILDWIQETVERLRYRFYK